MTEQKIQAKIIKTLEKDYSAYVVNGVYTKAGISDLIIGVPWTKKQVLKHFETHDTLAVFTAIEVKKPDTMSNVSPLQIYNINRVQKIGGTAFVASSVEQVKEKIGI